MAQDKDGAPSLSSKMGLKGWLGAFGELVAASVRAWHKGDAGRLAAALAYYALLSMAPTLYIVVFVAGRLYGAGPEYAALRGHVEALFGAQAGELFQSIMHSVQLAGRITWRTVVGLVALVWGGSGFFIHLQAALNAMWGVSPVPGRGALRIILSRLVSFGLVLGIGVLLFAAIIVNTTLTALGNALASLLPFSFLLMNFIQHFGFFLVFLVLMALMYKIVPDARIAWGDVWVGALVTAVLFTIGQIALSFYLGRTQFTTLYGVAGILVIVLIWVYYSAQIVFLGAQLTREYANRYGSRIRPTYGAKRREVSDAVRDSEFDPQD